MALNPQFPNYANGPAGTEVIGYTVVGGLPLYRLPVRMVDTGFGAAMVAEGSSIYSPSDDQFAPPKILSPGTLEGIFIEGETITLTPALVVGNVDTQTVQWYARTATGTTEIATDVNTYTLQTSDVGAFIFVRVIATNEYGTDSDVTASFGPVLPASVPVPTLTATFTPSTEVGTDASLEITACTDGTVTKVQVYADRAQPIQTVDVTALPVTVTQGGGTLVSYIGEYITFKVTIDVGGGQFAFVTYACGPIVGTAPVITGVGEINGTATSGSTLTFTPPSVTGTPTPTEVYYWYRQGQGGVIGSGLSYVATDDDLGKFLYVTTTATNILGGDTATSADFGPILGTAPVITDPGVLSPDNVSSGGVITLDPIPTATGNPAPSVSWVWRDGVDESRVLQLGGTTYVAKDSDIGASIVVASRAVNLSGEDTGLSNEVSVDTAPPTVVTPSVLFDLTPEVGDQIGGKLATFAGFPKPVITSFGFYDYTDPLNPVLLVDGEDVTTYDVKDSNVGKEIAFVTFAQNEYGTASSVSDISAPVSGYLRIVGESQESWTGIPGPGTVLLGEQATFEGVPAPVISQFGFAYDDGDGTYTPIIQSVGNESYIVQEGDIGTSIVFYTTATNSANPTGLTSYSNGTGTIQGPFEFVSQGEVIVPGDGPGSVIGLTLTNGGSDYVGEIGVPTVTIDGDGVGATATAVLAETGSVARLITQGASAAPDSTGTYTISGEGSETDIVVTWVTGTGGDAPQVTATLTDPGSGWSQANVDAALAGTYGSIVVTGPPTSRSPIRRLLIGTPVTNLVLTDGGSGYTSATVTITPAAGDAYGSGATATAQVGAPPAPAGTAPQVGDVLTLDYAITNPRNQKNTPSGPVVLSWTWVNSSDPTEPIAPPNAETYTVQPTDYGDKIMVVWTATAEDGDKLTDQTPYTLPVAQDAPVVLTNGSIAGDPNVIGSTATYTPATFSGNNVTVTWVWTDAEGTIWQENGLTLTLVGQMIGETLKVVATARNLGGTATATTPNFGPIGAGCLPVFDTNGTIVGDTDFPSVYELIPAEASAPSGCSGAGEPLLSWRWGAATDAAGTGFTPFPNVTPSSIEFDSADVTPGEITDKYVVVQTFAFNEAGTAGPVFSNAIGPIGDAPDVIEKGTISGTKYVGDTLTLDPIPAYSGSPEPTVTWEWVRRDAAGNLAVVQTGETTYQMQPEDVDCFIRVRSTGTNTHGTATATSNEVGPIVDARIPIITKPGQIKGDLILNNSILTYVAPEYVTSSPIGVQNWYWEALDNPNLASGTILQWGGTIFNMYPFLDTSEGASLNGKYLRVTMTLGTRPADTIKDVVTVGPITDVPLYLDLQTEGKVEGVSAGFSGPCCFPGSTLTFTPVNYRYLDSVAPVKSDWKWIWTAGNTGSITSVTVATAGCFPETSDIKVFTQGPCFVQAILTPQFALGKGVYSINVGPPPTDATAYPNPTLFARWEVNATGGGGNPAAVLSPRFDYREGDGLLYLSDLIVQSPGAGYTVASDADFSIRAYRTDGTFVVWNFATVGQTISVQGGSTISSIAITSSGTGYQSGAVSVVIDSKYDRWPAGALASVASGDTVVLAENVTEYTIPRTLGDGFLTVYQTGNGENGKEFCPSPIAQPIQVFGAKSPQDLPANYRFGVLVEEKGILSGQPGADKNLVSYRPVQWSNWTSNYPDPAAWGVDVRSAVAATPPEYSSLFCGPVSKKIEWLAYNSNFSQSKLLATDVLSLDTTGKLDPIFCNLRVEETCSFTTANNTAKVNSNVIGIPNFNQDKLACIPNAGWLMLETALDGSPTASVWWYPNRLPNGDKPGPNQNLGYGSGIKNVVMSGFSAKLHRIDITGTPLADTPITWSASNTDPDYKIQVAAAQPLSAINWITAYVQINYSSGGTLADSQSATVSVPPLATYISQGLDASFATLSGMTSGSAYSNGTGGIGGITDTNFCILDSSLSQPTFTISNPRMQLERLTYTDAAHRGVPFAAIWGGTEITLNAYRESGAQTLNSYHYVNTTGDPLSPEVVCALHPRLQDWLGTPVPVSVNTLYKWSWKAQQYGLDQIKGRVWDGITIPDLVGSVVSVTGTPQLPPVWKSGGAIRINGQVTAKILPVIGNSLDWSLSYLPAASLLEYGTIVGTGGSWWRCDLDGGNLVQIAGKGWTDRVDVPEAWLNQLVLFRQDASTAICGENPGTVKWSVCGPISQRADRPTPPL